MAVADFWKDRPDLSTPASAAKLNEFGTLVKTEARAQTATDIATPGTDTRDALDAAFSPRVGASPGARVVVLGNSIENSYSYITDTGTAASEQFGKDWPTFAMLASDGAFQLVRNSGVGGETTAQMLARYATTVTPFAPTMVVIGGAENDIQLSVTIATIRANITAMVEATYSIGAIPVLRTTMPHSASDAVRKRIGAYNHWVRDYGASHGIVVLDFWSLTVDPATGQYKAAYTADGVHPNEAASKVLGDYASTVLTPRTAISGLSIPADPTDAGLLAPARLFLTDTAGTPTSWNAIGGSPAGVTRSMVTDAAVPGRMARIAAVGSAVGVNLSNNSSIIDTDVAAAGDVLEVTGLLTSDGGITATITVTINYNDGVAKTISRLPVSGVKVALTRAKYRVRLPALPTGFTNVVIALAVGAGTGVVDFSYPGVRNLTAEGIV